MKYKARPDGEAFLARLLSVRETSQPAAKLTRKRKRELALKIKLQLQLQLGPNLAQPSDRELGRTILPFPAARSSALAPASARKRHTIALSAIAPAAAADFPNVDGSLQRAPAVRAQPVRACVQPSIEDYVSD